MELDSGALRRQADEALFDFDTTETLTAATQTTSQARAIDAIEFSVGMRFGGYNLYALGSPQTDKHAIVLAHLKAQAEKQDTPDDWCYLRNFDDPVRPLSVCLPPGGGRLFRERMFEAMQRVRTHLPAALSSDEFRREFQSLAGDLREAQSQDFAELESQAREMGLAMLPTPNGFVFAPTRDGRVMEEEDFLKLDDQEREKWQSAINTMTEHLVERLQEYPRVQQKVQDAQRELRQRTAQQVIQQALARVRSRYTNVPAIISWLEDVAGDLLANVEKIVMAGAAERTALQMPVADPEAYFDRFKVNVIVDHQDDEGAPVLYESNPSLDNLIGKLGQRVEYGTPVTDFDLIRSGALHRANGGYLLLDAERLLTKPFAWEALKRALMDSTIRIESVSQLLSLAYSVSMEPEPIPLTVKVVLLGDRRLYHLLRQYDSDFDDLFKVVADFDDEVDWTDESARSFASAMAGIVRDTGIRHLQRGAVCRVLEHCSRLVENQLRISTHTADIRDVLLEADYAASRNGADVISREHVSHAIERRIYRLDRFRELVKDNIAKGLIVVDTDGARVGQVNGLSVVSIGHVQFGQPSRITATARLGRGELVDIEREAHLGGNIHSKAVMIVSSFIGARYASDKPLSLRASLVFEQSYGGVEGDSASVAEVCALLSAIIDHPLRQNLAITGSMDQHGSAQAIGGVNEKIEGFFDVCSAQGLTGQQGVIIPASNAQHLMLREDVVAAASEGRFHVYTMETVDDAIALLFAENAGGRIDPDEVDRRVRERLDALHELAVAAAKAGLKSDAEEAS